MSPAEPAEFTTAIVRADGRWPAPPEWLSYSSLREAEECPLRWALTRASFPQTWPRSGYPSVPVASTLLGEIVHGALERIVVSLSAAGCASTTTAEAVAVLRKLGGYSAILRAVVDDRLASLNDNPRAAARLDGIARQMQERLPEMRQRTQATLSRTELVGSRAVARGPGHSDRDLRDGSYPEFELRASALGWAGRADLVTVEGTSVHILDYKTGIPHDHHAEQLRTYALLWARRDRRDPERPYATRLTLSYSSHDVAVAAPTPDELDVLERELRTRTATAKAELEAAPPPARPAPDVCGYCTVRHLCEAYWESSIPNRLEGFVDVELRITTRNGPRSWRARVAGTATEVIVRSAEDTALEPGVRVRVLSAHAARDQDNDLLVISLMGNTEVFALKP